MKIALNICAAIIVGVVILAGMKSCDPFSYLAGDNEKFILKGGVQQ